MEIFPEQRSALIRRFHITQNKKRTASILLANDDDDKKAREQKSIFVIGLGKA